MSNETVPEVRCPKCGSTQITANKKGFSGKKAVAGAIVTGGIGLLAGTIGSNKVKITCLACGNEFSPGAGIKPEEKSINEKHSANKAELDEMHARMKKNDVFIQQYKLGNGTAAYEQLKTGDPFAERYNDAETAYRKLTTAKRQTNILVFSIVAIIIAVIVWIAS